jgi:hypothetical protein
VPSDEAPDQAATKKPEAGAGTAPPPPPEESPVYAGAVYESRGLAAKNTVTIALSPLSLLSDPYFVEGHIELRIFGPVSVLFRGGAGSFKREPPSSDPSASDRGLGWRFGGGARAYFDARNPLLAGAFFGIEEKWDDAKDGARWLHFVPGLTLDFVAGYKLVTAGGFTLETQLGASAVATDRRPDTMPRPRVVPTWDIAIGYTF